MTCAGCGEQKEPDELAANTGLCYACEQAPSPIEANAFNAGVTVAQAREVMDGIARWAAAELPLTATSVGRRIRSAAREIGKESIN